MRKFSFLLALLCASMMGWAADQDTYLGVAGGCGDYANKVKWFAIDGVATPSNVVEIQKSGDIPSIYVTFADAAFNSVEGCEWDNHVNGACMWVHLPLTNQYTDIYVKNNGTIRWGFTIYYADGATSSATETSDLTCTSDAALVLDPTATSAITYTTSSTGAVTYKSSNNAVATVNNSGVITAVAHGEAIITVEQEADDTYKKGSFDVNVSVNMAKQASGMGFGTLHLEDVDLYDWDGNFAANNACGKVDLYVVTWGNNLIYKANVKEGKTFENCTNYFCQLRTWKTDLTDIAEHWALTCSPDLTTRYMETTQTANAPGLAKYGDEIKLTSYMVLSGCGARTMKTVSYTRDYINNINVADVTAPSLGVATVTSGTDDITISFAEVTSEPVFYMIEDAEHNKKYFSMVPSFVLPKDGSGITYNYSCYAIDFNGNKSVAQLAEVMMPFSVLTNLALNKQAYSATTAGADYLTSKAVDGNAATRWSPGGVANAEDAWWAIDLGTIYNLTSLEMVWEGAYSDNFVIYGADNKPSTWNDISKYETTLVTNTVMPNVGNDNNNVYSVSGHARYLLFMPSHLANNAWGASFWEFRAFGTGVYDPSAGVDNEKPVITAASLTSKTHNTAVIALTASDDVGIIKVKAVDSTNGLDEDMVPSEGSITLTNLLEQTTYTITLTAYDAANNFSDAFVMDAFTTEVDPTIPQVSASTPSGTNKEILPIYSDAFASILEHSFDKDGFAGMPLYMEKDFSGDHCLIYDRSGSALVFTTWGMYDDGANAIIAQSAYRAEGKMGVDASAMENLHIDIWSLQACNTILVRINDGGRTGDLRLSHDGSGWKSYDIPLSEFVAGANVDNVRWFKFEAFDAITGKVAIDNVYFWKTVAGMASVSATPNHSEMGTATVNGVSATEVTSGAEVTFSAVANSGYIFVDWSNGNTNATFTTTADASMNLTANFRALGTTYCNTEMTANGHTVYVTMKRSDVNEYTLTVRSTDEMTGFGNTVLYKPVNTVVQNVHESGVLSDANHTLTATISADKDLYFGTPLYVIFAGVGEVQYPTLTNIEYAVSCEDAEVESIALDVPSATVEVGATRTLIPSFTPAYAIDKTVTWTTSDASIASVTSSGVVRGESTGNATITATCNGKTATCAITVVAATAKTLYGASIESVAGGSVGINYSITRSLDGKLHYAISWSDDLPALGDVSINDGDWHSMTKNGRSAEWTSTDTYSSGDVIYCFFHLPYQGGVIRIDVAYTAGSDNEAEKPNTYVTLNDEATDNPTRISNNENVEVDVIFTRTFPLPEEWYTLCLPFDMNEAQLTASLGAGYTLATLTSSEDRGTILHLNFNYVRSLVAGIPYMFKPGAGVTERPIFEGVTIPSGIAPIEVGDAMMKFKGTFTQITLDSEKQRFVGPENYLYSPAEGGTAMDAFRCYFTIPDGSPYAGMPGKRARIVFGEQTATGIGDVQTDQVLSTKVLRDGQLFIIRDGRTYNAQGMVVK